MRCCHSCAATFGLTALPSGGAIYGLTAMPSGGAIYGLTALPSVYYIRTECSAIWYCCIWTD